MSTKLLPCPFCGTSDPEYDNCDHGSGQWYSCRGCPVVVKVSYGVDLAAAWNSRATMQPPIPPLSVAAFCRLHGRPWDGKEPLVAPTMEPAKTFTLDQLHEACGELGLLREFEQIEIELKGRD